MTSNERKTPSLKRLNSFLQTAVGVALLAALGYALPEGWEFLKERSGKTREALTAVYAEFSASDDATRTKAVTRAFTLDRSAGEILARRVFTLLKSSAIDAETETLLAALNELGQPGLATTVRKVRAKYNAGFADPARLPGCIELKNDLNSCVIDAIAPYDRPALLRWLCPHPDLNEKCRFLLERDC